jgi:peptide-methionine (S)-S-oxide reductase
MTNKQVVFGGGCFWCTESIFKQLKSVLSVTPGYAGGTLDNPSYEQVGSGNTGHAEVVRVEFDPQIISFTDLLSVFFATHNPTTPNQQGNDFGSQYRSIILYTNPEQEEQVEKYILELKKSLNVVTELAPLKSFFPAEYYHKNYYENNPNKPYCQLVIEPKLIKLKEKFKDLLK